MATITVNLWDDYVDDGEGVQETYAYVEEDASLEKQKRVLEGLQSTLTKWALARGLSVRFEIAFSDGFEKYPSLVGTENEAFLFRRWELHLTGLAHVDREALVDLFPMLDCVVDDARIRLISES